MAGAGGTGARPRRRRDEPPPVIWLIRKTLAQHSHLPPGPAPQRTEDIWAELRLAVVWLAVMAVMAFAAKWLQHHAWLLVGIGRGVPGYLDGLAIDVVKASAWSNGPRLS